MKIYHEESFGPAKASCASTATFLSGSARAALGETQVGIAQMQHDAELVARNTGVISSWMAFLLAGSCAQIGQYDEGQGHLSRAVASIEQTGERWCEAELYRLQGELLLGSTRAAGSKAEAFFRCAIDTARKQGSKSWELRAITSLARLLRDTGRRDEARAMLADIYGWFTEGFDTADLKDAKALLDELKV
jgi:predicted ATPase